MCILWIAVGGIFLYGEGGVSGFEYQEGAGNWLCEDGKVYRSWGVYHCRGGGRSRGFQVRAAEILPEEEEWVDFARFCDEDIEICPVGRSAGFFFFTF